MIWKQQPDLETINRMGKDTLQESLGIEFTEFGDDYLKARMPVDNRTVQPMRLLHGGASVALAETLGSVASILCIEDIGNKAPVGVEINANHLRSAREGFVIGTVKAIKTGRRLHVWNIEICNESGDIVCTSRLTTMIIDK